MEYEAAVKRIHDQDMVQKMREWEAKHNKSNAELFVAPSSRKELMKFISEGFTQKSNADPRPFSSGNDFCICVASFTNTGDLAYHVIE